MNKKKILLIEDNELNRKLAKALLQRGPYDLLESPSAETGIKLTLEHQPDLILMDIQLPGMDGLTATRMIREIPALKKIRIVALTSYAMEGDAENAKKAGCDGYLSKPINTRTFLDTINAFFPADPETESSAGKGPVVKSTILIVDDDPLNVKVLAAKLPLDRYEVIKAYSGEEALGKVAGRPLDLILLDIMMPGMDGYEVTRRLKNDPETRNIPILILTSLDGPEEKGKALGMGADEFINKPFNDIELLSRIESLIRLKGYREELAAREQSKESFESRTGNEQGMNEKTVEPSVLVVEDNPSDAKLIQQYLAGSPFHVELIKDGEEALARAEMGKIDLILLDILLPGMNGLEICRRLKEREQTRAAQIILITCLDDLGTKFNGIKFGADDYLVKPVNRHELKARVNALLEKKGCLDRLRGNGEDLFPAAAR